MKKLIYFFVATSVAALSFTSCKTPEPTTEAFGAPKGVKAELNDPYEAMTISWSAVTDADSYKVYKSNSSTGTFAELATVTALNYADSLPLEGKNYYKIKALKGTEVSDFSDVASCSTSALVRFNKVQAFSSVLAMAVFSTDVSVQNPFAIYIYTDGTTVSGGESPYYEIPSGSHQPLFYYAGDTQNEAGYYYIIDDAPNTYAFGAGNRYTVVCDVDSESYLTFGVTQDAASGAPAAQYAPVNTTTVKEAKFVGTKARPFSLK